MVSWKVPDLVDSRGLWKVAATDEMKGLWTVDPRGGTMVPYLVGLMDASMEPYSVDSTPRVHAMVETTGQEKAVAMAWTTDPSTVDQKVQ